MFNILMGCSSSGKDAIQRKLVSDYGYKSLVSVTSRPMRDGEVWGRDYYFVTDDEFKKMINSNELIEHRTYDTLVDNVEATWYYGLPKKELDANDKYAVVLDVQGTKDFIDYYGLSNCNIYHIITPKEIRTERAIKRGGFNKTEWERRLKADTHDFERHNMINTLGEIIYSDIQNIYNYGLEYNENSKLVPANCDLNSIVKRVLEWDI